MNEETKKVETRVYAVRNKETSKVRLIDAPNSAEALRFVSNDTLEVSLATTKQVALLVGQGATLEVSLPESGAE